MNWFKRLFKKELPDNDLKDLLLAFGKDKNYIMGLYSHGREYTHGTYGKLDVQEIYPGKIRFDLYLQEYRFKRFRPYAEIIEYDLRKTNIKKDFSYQEIEKNPILKKYFKNK